MTSSNSSSNSSSNTTLFADSCERYAVDSRLLCNDIEQVSNKRFHRSRQLISWTRRLAVAAVASAGVAGLGAYYQRAQIHRVWRLRNPHRVRQLSLLTMLCGGFSACAVLFLISPVGPMRLHDVEVARTHQLDAIAVAALVLEQNFRTLDAWAEKEGDSVRAAASPQRQQPQQWVWKEVVVDITPALSGKKAAAPSTAPTLARAEKVKDAVVATSAAQREGAAMTKDDMAAHLLFPASPASADVAPTEKGGWMAESDVASGRKEAHAPLRRVYAYTKDAAVLQSAFEASVEAWEVLTKAKTDIVAGVL